MDKYTILDQAGAGTGVAPAREGESLAAARRDQEAALQLLAERAQYLTGASGASIALYEGKAMVCRGSAGRAAPEVGTEIETDSGLMAESIRTRQFADCRDADSDPRVNRESCEELGVRSVMVKPLLREEEVVGVFELVGDRASAFAERDVEVLTRLAEMALTAVEHAEAAQRALPALPAAGDEAPAEDLVPETAGAEAEELSSPGAELLPTVSAEVAQIGSCEACGFPVSQGRTLCVDCENAGRSGDAKPVPWNATGREESWFQTHSYTIGTLLIAAVTLALLALKLR